MKKEFEAKYHDLEGFHWLFKSRRNMILRLLRNCPKESTIENSVLTLFNFPVGISLFAVAYKSNVSTVKQ
ncbi:MAG: hypothetical protein AABZ14_04380 [Candidatus Margulisiibacteriota bacterium]